MNVTVIGAGGLGGYYGGLLARAGHAVTFVARGAHLEALRRQGGVRVQAADGQFLGPARAVGTPAEAPPADLVLFTVKSFDTRAAAEALAGTLAPQTAVLSLQNGVTNEEVLAEVCGAGRILGGAAYVFATIAAPGVIAQTGGPRRVVVGEWPGGASPRVWRLVQTLRDAGWVVEPTDDIVREKWIKYAFICAHAGMTALTRLPIGAIRDCPPAWAMFRQILEEVAAVGRARGVHLPDDLVERHLAFAQQLEPHGSSSLATDLAQGRRLEVEALHGTVVRQGQALGIPTPACAAVYAALLPHEMLASEARAHAP
jgi:2-dehydropantoate 2-reductase